MDLKRPSGRPQITSMKKDSPRLPQVSQSHTDRSSERGSELSTQYTNN